MLCCTYHATTDYIQTMFPVFLVVPLCSRYEAKSQRKRFWQRKRGKRTTAEPFMNSVHIVWMDVMFSGNIFQSKHKTHSYYIFNGNSKWLSMKWKFGWNCSFWSSIESFVYLLIFKYVFPFCKLQRTLNHLNMKSIHYSVIWKISASEVHWK